MQKLPKKLGSAGIDVTSIVLEPMYKLPNKIQIGSQQAGLLGKSTSRSTSFHWQLPFQISKDRWMMMNASSCLSKSPRKFVALNLPKSPLEANSSKMTDNITISLRTSYPMNHHESKVVTYIYNVYMPPSFAEFLAKISLHVLCIITHDTV